MSVCIPEYFFSKFSCLGPGFVHVGLWRSYIVWSSKLKGEGYTIWIPPGKGKAFRTYSLYLNLIIHLY